MYKRAYGLSELKTAFLQQDNKSFRALSPTVTKDKYDQSDRTMTQQYGGYPKNFWDLLSIKTAKELQDPQMQKNIHKYF